MLDRPRCRRASAPLHRLPERLSRPSQQPSTTHSQAGPGEHDLSEAPATIDGEFYFDWSGWAADIADLDGDGFDDLAVGSPGSFEWLAIPGRTSVFLGPLSGALGREDAAAVYVGGALYDHAGASVAIGDKGGSGRLDLAIGAPFADPGGVSGAGELYLLSDPL